MNQNLLIVDDEYDALAWMEEMFKYDFDKEIDVYSASSAIEALKLLNSVKFDVVLTDVRMPGMDGITLFEKIKNNWPRCKTVFLTGYRNFDDMYRIVNHKDVRFILKSERDDVIKQAVRDALDEFRIELEQETISQIQNEDMEKIRYWMHRDFMNDLLNGKVAMPEEIDKRASVIEFSIRLSDKLLLALIRIDPTKSVTINSIIEETDAIGRMLRRNLPQDIKICLHVVENQQAVLMIQPMDNQTKDWNRVFTVLKGVLEYVQVTFRKNYHKGFSAVITSTPINYEMMAKTIAGLKQIMVGYLGGEQEVVVHAETFMAGQRGKSETGGIYKIPLLKSYLELQRRMSYFELLNQLCEELSQISSRHDTHAMELYYSISIMLLQFINEGQLNEKLAFYVGLYKLTKVDEHSSWAVAAQYLFEVSVAIFNLLGDNEHILSDKALKRVLDYISDNLSGDLTLTKLAEVGGFNSSYLSRLFKQNMRVSISDYVYEKRIELSKQLLVKTNQKIQDIGIRSGYPSAQSFTRAFRNHEGITPVEYRELHRKK